MKLSIVTIFRLGEISELIKTLNSVKKQTCQPYQHLLVISNINDENEFKELLDYDSGLFIINQDRSLYNAMNIGLHHADGDAVYFLNGGDQLHSINAIKIIIEKMKPGVDCLLFRTIQYYKNDGYIRPKLNRIHTLKVFPAHQGFVAKLEVAKQYKFKDSVYAINADLLWMRNIINELPVVICPEIIAIFSLGGVSNLPSLSTCKMRIVDSGFGKGIKELCKLILYKILKGRQYYRFLYFKKYEYVDLKDI
jgi:glycosyltransferase involved in cell wall biosynthesis